MTGKKHLWIIAGMIWVLLLETGMLWCKKPDLSRISGEIAMSANMTCYVVDETEENTVIYEVNKNGEILHFFRDTPQKGRIFHITWTDAGIWYLKQTADAKRNDTYDIYQIIKETPQSRGSLTLKPEDRIVEMGQDKSGMYLAVIEENNTKLSIYHWNTDGNKTVKPRLTNGLKAKDGISFTDGAYWEETVYALTDSGVMVTEEKEEPGVTWLTGTRAGLLFETYPERYLYMKGNTGTKKYEGLEQAAEADAMSQKAFWTIQSGEDHTLKFTQNHKNSKVEHLYMKISDYLYMRGKAILATAIIGTAVWFLLVMAVKFFRGKPPLWVKAGTAVLGIQLLVSIAAAGALKTQEWEEFALLWGKKEAERLEQEIPGFPDPAVLKQLKPLAKLRADILYKEKLKVSSMVISTKNGKGYVISASERSYGYDIDKLFSQQTLDAVALAQDEGEPESNGEAAGSRYAEAVIPLGNKIAADTFLIVRIEQLSESDLFRQKLHTILWILADSFILGMVCFLLFHPVKKFAGTVNRIAEGMQVRIPVSRSRELEQAWHSVQVMLFQREREHHEADRSIQSSSRFIPQYFLKLMEKQKIDEVLPDKVKTVIGGIVQIYLGNLGKQEEMTYGGYISRIMTLFQQEREQKMGVLFPGGNCLNSMRVIYKNMPEAAVQDAIGVWKRMNGSKEMAQQRKPVFLLHSGSAVCGVAGTEQQVIPFAVSKELEWLERIAEQFHNCNVRMVVTDAMLSCLRTEQQYRFVGYMIRDDKKYQFYEVLEVYPEEEKQCLCRTKEKFAASIKLFYDNDFYLARLGFSEVLKECPKDRLAIWYLFACEKMFHGNYGENPFHDLFAEEIEGKS